MPKRRGRGEGCIYRRADGRYSGQITTGRDEQGRQKRETVYGHTKQAVLDKLTALRATLKDALLAGPDSPLSVFIEFYLDCVVKLGASVGTHDRYWRTARGHIVPYLGGVGVRALNAMDVAQWYRKMEEAGTPSAARHLAAKLLRQVLRYAVKTDRLAKNVSLQLPLPKRIGRDIQPFSVAQVHALLGAARKPHQLLYLVALDSGARQGELFALTWPDVDFGAGEISVTKTLYHGACGFLVKEPKSTTSRRRVRLAPQTLAGLQELRSAARDDGLVFRSYRGEPTSYLWTCSAFKAYKRTLKRAGLPSTHRWHDLRHTCATLLLQAGVHVKVVQERLGHSDITTTLRTYSHVMPSMQERAVAAMTAILTEPEAVAKQ